MIDVPGPSRRRRPLRALAPWFAPFVGSLFAYLYVVPVVERWHVPPPLSQLLGLAIAATLMLPFTILVASSRSNDYGMVKLARPVLVASACAACAVLGGVFVEASGASPALGGGIAWFALTGTVVWSGTFRYARGSRDALLERVLRADRPEEAPELVERCRRLLADGRLNDEQRTRVSLSLAGALVSVSSLADQPDSLGEAVAILDRTIASGPPALAFEAASRLVDAMRVKLRRTGDDSGYDAALDVMTATAERAAAEVPGAERMARGARAVRLSERAAREPVPEEADRLRSLALAEQAAAMPASSEHVDSSDAASVAVVARIAGADPGYPDLDGAIRTCRLTLRRLRWKDDRRRREAMLALVDLLELRAIRQPDGGLGGMLNRLWPGRPRHGVIDRLWPDRASNDLMRAMFLCQRLALTGAEHAPEARTRLPRLRDRLIRTARPGLPRRLDRMTGWMYSHVVREQSGRSGSSAADVAAEWVEWSRARDDESHSAEAWWCWVTATTADLRRRVLHDKQHRIASIQGQVVEAARALAGAGRLCDAAVALDLGRAVLLTERMHRDRDDLESRLIAAGQAELAARWRAAAEAIQRTDRRAFEPGTRSSHEARTPIASEEYAVLTAHDRLLREIARIPGFEDVDAPLDYDELREAALEGPLVYLAAAENGGFALLVDRGPEPRFVEMPLLRSRMVEAHAQRLLAADGSRAIGAELDALLPAFRSAAVVPLSAHVAAGSLVTLVPVGALAELPIHAAGAAPGPDGVWRDRTDGVVFRCSPNARVLLRAERTARTLAGEGLRLLTAGVPNPPGLPRLRRATAESDAVAGAFPPDRVERPRPADVTSVRHALDRCSVWHFACHGIHDPRSPLDSTLALADGPLTLRTIFAAPSARRRLAVLSACETSALGGTMLDEVVGFPAAMLQAGVAGVVSCHAAVEDHAAMLLVLRFFSLFLRSGSPARALAEAQDWLRTSTNADISAEFPHVHEPPQDERPDLRRWLAQHPFAGPASWALFSYTGA